MYVCDPKRVGCKKELEEEETEFSVKDSLLPLRHIQSSDRTTNVPQSSEC